MNTNVNILFWNIAAVVKRQLSVIGKRSVDDNGQKLFSDITVGSNEEPILLDYIKEATVKLIAETDIFVTALSSNDTQMAVGYTFPANHREVFDSVIKTAMEAYCVSYTLYSWFTVVAPRIAPKYLEDAKRHLGEIIRLAYSKEPPTSSNSSGPTVSVVSPPVISGLISGFHQNDINMAKGETRVFSYTPASDGTDDIVVSSSGSLLTITKNATDHTITLNAGNGDGVPVIYITSQAFPEINITEAVKVGEGIVTPDNPSDPGRDPDDDLWGDDGEVTSPTFYYVIGEITAVNTPQVFSEPLNITTDNDVTIYANGGAGATLSYNTSGSGTANVTRMDDDGYTTLTIRPQSGTKIINISYGNFSRTVIVTKQSSQSGGTGQVISPTFTYAVGEITSSNQPQEFIQSLNLTTDDDVTVLVSGGSGAALAYETVGDGTANIIQSNSNGLVTLTIQPMSGTKTIVLSYGNYSRTITLTKQTQQGGGTGQVTSPTFSYAVGNGAEQALTGLLNLTTDDTVHVYVRGGTGDTLTYQTSGDGNANVSRENISNGTVFHIEPLSGTASLDLYYGSYSRTISVTKQTEQVTSPTFTYLVGTASPENRPQVFTEPLNITTDDDVTIYANGGSGATLGYNRTGNGTANVTRQDNGGNTVLTIQPQTGTATINIYYGSYLRIVTVTKRTEQGGGTNEPSTEYRNITVAEGESTTIDLPFGGEAQIYEILPLGIISISDDLDEQTLTIYGEVTGSCTLTVTNTDTDDKYIYSVTVTEAQGGQGGSVNGITDWNGQSTGMFYIKDAGNGQDNGMLVDIQNNKYVSNPVISIDSNMNVLAVADNDGYLISYNENTNTCVSSEVYHSGSTKRGRYICKRATEIAATARYGGVTLNYDNSSDCLLRQGSTNSISLSGYLQNDDDDALRH